MRTDKMHLVAYLMIPTCHHHGMWRHPYSEVNFDEVGYYTKIARALEDGKWDMFFLPDVLTVYGNYRGGFEETVKRGGQGALSLDPAVLLASVVASTTHLGLGATLSATLFPPFHIARSIGTLDLISGGRAAWNVVMSTSDAEAQNFGMDEIPDREGRYSRGDEVVGLVKKLWASWEPDAIKLDKEGGIFADPSKVHFANFTGEKVRARGPLGVPPSRQGSPVIMQAGSSPRGKQFAAEWGEVIFTLQHSITDMQTYYQDIKTRVSDGGRDPAKCRILPAAQFIVGETETIAKERFEYMNSLIDPEVGLATMSLHVGFDLSGYPLDEPVKNVEVKTGSRGSFDVILQGTQAENLTLGEAAVRFASSELTPQLVGTATQIADQIEHMFQSYACDGFVITPTHMPGSWEDISRAVVPELQRRGIFRKDYEGSTLRSHFGLA